jgi:hypothetical protein
MRSPVDGALRDLARVLDALGMSWFLFGAQAAIIYGSTRVTEDIDVTVELGECGARELFSALKRGGFTLRVADSAAFVEKTRVLPIVHRSTSMPVDIVFAGPGLEELFLARTRRHIRGGRSIPVASPEDLIVMKLLAGRPRDIDDIRAVLRSVGPKLDVSVVTTTLALLEEALAQNDLRPLFDSLFRESAGRARRSTAPLAKRRAAAAPTRAATKARDARGVAASTRSAALRKGPKARTK